MQPRSAIRVVLLHFSFALEKQLCAFVIHRIMKPASLDFTEGTIGEYKFGSLAVKGSIGMHYLLLRFLRKLLVNSRREISFQLLKLAGLVDLLGDITIEGLLVKRQQIGLNG